MKFYERKKVENCFGGTNVYEYLLINKSDETFIEGFQLYGEIRYYRNFPRPFFQVSFSNGAVMKGIIGDQVIKVKFPGISADEQAAFDNLLTEQIRKTFSNEER